MKATFFFLLFCILFINVVAQAPQAVKYQAVVRDGSGSILADKVVFLKISILSGSPTGAVVYKENHTNETTNTFGLVNIDIGKGAPETGTFSTIDWSIGSYFVKVEIFPAGATAWQEMGTSPLLSVPYALYAKDVQNKDDADADATNEIQVLSKSGNTVTLSKNGGNFTDAVDDADADPANELQELQLTGTVLGLSKSVKTVTLPSSGGGDNWGTQVVKTYSSLIGQGTDANPLGVANAFIAPSWVNIQNTPAGFADGIDNVNDADTSITNEIQTLSINGSNLFLSKEGGTVTIPGDNWGTQSALTNITLTGNGTTTSPLGVVQSQLQPNWVNITGKPSTFTGYGITDGMSTSHVANGITQNMITNWNTAYNWGNHSGLYRPAFWVPAWNEINQNPFLIESPVTDQLLRFDGAHWINFTPDSVVFGSGQLTDTDRDTKIVTELVPDDDHLRFYTEGMERLHITPTGNFETFGGNHSLYIGSGAGKFSTGIYNVFVGDSAGFQNTIGKQNTVSGYHALYSNTTGESNTASGFLALESNTIGNANTAIGFFSLQYNTSGSRNTAIGGRALMHNNNGVFNVAIGYQALTLDTIGSFNTATGTFALRNNSGFHNTANGHAALYWNNTGCFNTAVGDSALFFNQIGSDNTATGQGALFNNTHGIANTATGRKALFMNSTGNCNTAVGYHALYSNTTGWYNTAIGDSALFSNTAGNNNTANGRNAMYLNTTGNANTATGRFALYSNTNGYLNTASGQHALYSNTTGHHNTGYGYAALNKNTTGTYNTAIGMSALIANTTGNYNTAIGYNANVGRDSLTNATAIGNGALVNASNKIVLGNSDAITVGGYGNWSNYSDRRLKENIVYKNDPGLNFITQLNPVSFNYIDDTNKRRRDGLIAQDVEKILKDLGIEFSGLIIDDDPMKTMNLSYTEFVIPLINAVKELKAENGQQQTKIEALEFRLSKLESLSEATSKK